jgi:hypothetical protein
MFGRKSYNTELKNKINQKTIKDKINVKISLKYTMIRKENK